MKGADESLEENNAYVEVIDNCQTKVFNYLADSEHKMIKTEELVGRVLYKNDYFSEKNIQIITDCIRACDSNKDGFITDEGKLPWKNYKINFDII